MAEDEQLARDHSAWLKQFPVREMEKRGWIEEESRPSARLRELLKFFAIPSFNALGADHRRDRVPRH